MSLSSPFIKRPVGTVLLAFGLFLGGVLAYSALPVAPLPRVDYPTIFVTASLPGASPETMASAVATPLERRLGRIAGLNEMTSNSSMGNASIVMQFDLGRTQNSAARDVQAAINASYVDLPSNLPVRPRYRKVNPADSPILILALRSTSLPVSQVYEAANTSLAQTIARVEGVGQVFVAGAQQPAVRVQVDATAALAADLTLEDIRTAIASSTAHQPKGVFDGQHLSAAISGNDQLTRAHEYRSLLLKSTAQGSVRLSDVASVTDDVENDRAAAWVDGERAVLIMIRRQPDANIIDVVDRVIGLLPELSSALPPSVSLEVAMDRSQTIRASVRDVEHTLLISVALVTLVVFVFLGSVRATLIPSVAVPLSLVATFGVMWLLDFSLNNLSLMALTIATGFVVDDAIVVTENIERHLEQGKSRLQAALIGAKQIGFTVLSITVSLLAAFMPLFLMGGMLGRMFREFALTLGAAISVSALISLTLTPTLCGQWLKSRRAEHGAGWFGRVERGYARSLGFVIQNPLWMLGLTLLLIAASVQLFQRMPKGLFPQQDTGVMFGSTEAPQDVSFTQLRQRQEAMNRAVQQHPEVAKVLSFVGAGPGGSSSNTGSLFVSLRPQPARKQSTDEVIADLRKNTAKVRGMQLFMQSAQDLRMGGRRSRTQFQYTLQANSLEELQTWAPKVVEGLKGVKELRDVNSDQQSAGLRLMFEIDRDAASRFGISARQIDATLYDAFGQRHIATLYTEVNQYHVVMEVKPEQRGTPDALDGLYLRSAAGQLVPLSALGKARPGAMPLSVNHQGQFPAITLSFNLAPDASLGQAMDAIEHVKRDQLWPASLKGGFQGSAQVFADSLAQQPILILIAVIAVYMVLGILYESYIHPLTILSTLPSAGVGALLALWIANLELDLLGLVGIVLLIGIVKKNAIMMIDFALEAERTHGLNAHAAILRAAELRIRPILMTSFAAALGALPLALGTGLGSELRRPLGVAIVGGLIVSQVVTIYTTPCVYVLLDRFSRHKRRDSAPEASALSGG
ncbi:MAG TPA: efflux RND transporter permease subunit [Polyangiales bacterium]|nr:efflux RND transporter permease subunit [Polyangiales bacterium]